MVLKSPFLQGNQLEKGKWYVGTSLSSLNSISLPLIVGNIGPGAGEGIRLAVGCTIFGGMLISTFLTLFTTPVFYLLLCKNSKRMDEIDIRLSKEFSK